MVPLCPPVGADLNQLREEVRLYSCTPRNVSVSLREELRRTDVIFWPGCLLVQRCGGNCCCSQCSQSCSQSGDQCACVPSRTSRKYYEVLLHERSSAICILTSTRYYI